jgi:hypothetical protein
MKFGKARKIFIVEDDELQSSLLMDRLTRDIPHTVTIFPHRRGLFETYP